MNIHDVKLDGSSISVTFFVGDGDIGTTAEDNQASIWRLDDHVSRREAAALLGFASEFKVRQLEKEGQAAPDSRRHGFGLVPPVGGGGIAGGCCRSGGAQLWPRGGVTCHRPMAGRRADSSFERVRPRRTRMVVTALRRWLIWSPIRA